MDEQSVEKLGSERDNEFNLGMDRTKALYLPHPAAYPHLHVLDREALSEADAALLGETCPPGSIDLKMKEERFEVDVGAIIVATGWEPYDANKLDNLGFGRLPDVITNVMMERLAAVDGPTGGKILRPSDGKPARNVAFVQCAGSRDENHLPYCSAVCCMASLKQVRYLREKNEDSKATVFYIDIRTVGALEKFYYELLDDENVSFVKGKAAKIEAASAAGEMALEVEDTLSGEKLQRDFDLVVLATGIVPSGIEAKLPLELPRDPYGFVDGSTEADGIYAAGCAGHPCDVSTATKEGTAAALKAIQCLSKGV